jgi:hypothetical protein
VLPDRPPRWSGPGPRAVHPLVCWLVHRLVLSLVHTIAENRSDRIRDVDDMSLCEGFSLERAVMVGGAGAGPEFRQALRRPPRFAG